MKNQFYYTRLEKIEKPLIDGKEQPEEFKSFIDSFNINKVIRTVQMPDERFLVLLDDFHSKKQEMPVLNKQNKPSGMKTVEDTFHSEIYISKEDGFLLKNLIMFN